MAYKNHEDGRAANKRWRLANAEKNKARLKKWRLENPEKVRLKSREWREKNLEKVRASHRKWCHSNSTVRKKQYRKYRLKWLYGLTPETYDALLVAQQFKCAGCGVDLHNISRKQRHVDHCHKTGSVRGILCQACNTALGLLQENPERMRSLATYIETAHDRDVNAARNILSLALSAQGPVEEYRRAA